MTSATGSIDVITATGAIRTLKLIGATSFTGAVKFMQRGVRKIFKEGLRFTTMSKDK